MKNTILDLLNKRIKENEKKLKEAKEKDDLYFIAYYQGVSIETLEI